MKHGVIVVSDEIHSDFVWKGHKHTIFASLSEEYADISVTCTAPSKTFNLAGLQTSNISSRTGSFVIVSEKRWIRQATASSIRWDWWPRRAAYEEGGEWL